MLLNSKQIESNLKKLPKEWTVVSGSSLDKVFNFPDFSSGVGFIVEVAKLADKADHHPDVTLSWGKVEISLMTHEESGLTQKDFDLASQIEKIKR